MRLIIKQVRFFMFVPFLTFCGTSPTIQMNLTGTAAFADTSVRDIVFIFQSQASGTGILDQDGNGQPDFFVYPTSCGAAMPAGCGPAPNPGNITVGELPLDYSYLVIVRLRSSAGATLYEGQATFSNVENAAAVNVVVE
jgi:hypothetical protein